MTEIEAVQAADGSWSFDPVVVASAIPVKPPAAWFDDPGLTEPTALTVTADGRVFGHACAWNVRHIGLPGNRTAPRSRTDYKHYRTGQVETADGSMVATGRITMGAGHADLSGDIVAASDHYDNVCAAIADVACGEDSHGLWFAGALRPEATPEQIRTLRASSVSGDWRGIGQGLELCGILAVNVPGFSVPRAGLAASGQEVTSLIAAGIIAPSTDTEEAVVAAPPPPPAKKGPPPAPPREESMVPPGVEPGMRVKLSGEFTGVIKDVDEDEVGVEITVPADVLEPADEEDAVAASAVVRDLSTRLERAEAQLRDSQAERLLASVPAPE